MDDIRVVQFFIGIDPGVSGSLAVIDRSLKVHLLIDWPGDETMAAKFVGNLKTRHGKSIHAALERAHSMPKQGVKSMFTYGTNYGVWKGILAAFKIPFTFSRAETINTSVLFLSMIITSLATYLLAAKPHFRLSAV